jgi:hypothetical protein
MKKFKIMHPFKFSLPFSKGYAVGLGSHPSPPPFQKATKGVNNHRNFKKLRKGVSDRRRDRLATRRSDGEMEKTRKVPSCKECKRLVKECNKAPCPAKKRRKIEKEKEGSKMEVVEPKEGGVRWILRRRNQEARSTSPTSS